MDKLSDLVLELLGFDTQNNDEVEEGKALKGETLGLLEFVKERLSRQANVNVEIQEYSIDYRNSITLSNRGNLIAYLDDSSDLPRVLLQGHVDTVPFGKFQETPRGKIEGDVIYGRGAADMKGPVAAMITAFERIARMENRKYSPVLLLTSDEEARGFAGIKNFFGHNKLKIDFGICGEPTDFSICNRCKGATSRTLTVVGTAAHGSRPDLGRNAIYGAALIVKLLEDFSEYVNKNLTNPEFESDNDYSMRSTLNVGKIVGGNKVNSVPESCRIEFEMRLVYPVERYDIELKKRVYDKIPDDIEYVPETVFGFEPFTRDTNDSFSGELVNAIKQNGKNCNFRIMGGLSEATFTNDEGIKTLVFGPGGEGYAHSAEEQIKLEDLKLYENILVSFFRS